MKVNNTIAHFISSRLSDYKKSKITSLFIRISFYSVALSMMVMVLSTFLISGFKHELEHKMSVLYGDLVITESSDINNTFSQKPLFYFSSDSLQLLREESDIDYATPYLLDFVMIRSGSIPQGVMVRSADYSDDSPEKEFLIDGRLPRRLSEDTMTYEVVLSNNITKRLGSGIGNTLVSYFSTSDQDILVRKLKVVGVYNSSVYEHDDAVIWSDISLQNDIRDIHPDYYHAISIILNNPKNVEIDKRNIWQKYLHNPLKLENISERFGYITDWIQLQQTNEYIILAIMFMIALINMISCVLILILDRLPMIGSLKAIGASNHLLQRVFLQLAQRIILRGILWGNILAIAIAFLQKKFKLFTLPEEFYLIQYVPIHYDWGRWVIINLAFFVLLSIALIIPTLIINRLKPIQILRYK